MFNTINFNRELKWHLHRQITFVVFNFCVVFNWSLKFNVDAGSSHKYIILHKKCDKSCGICTISHFFSQRFVLKTSKNCKFHFESDIPSANSFKRVYLTLRFMTVPLWTSFFDCIWRAACVYCSKFVFFLCQVNLCVLCSYRRINWIENWIDSRKPC